MRAPNNIFSFAAETPPVSVALPVKNASATLPAAIECLNAQTIPELEILIVLNGADSDSRSVAARAAKDNKRIRILSLPEANLAAALNLAIDQAKYDFVARMDADDTCAPERLALQSQYMAKHPRVAALGCAYEIADEEGRVISTIRPPTDPKELRWRLLLGNILAHGSMVLRKAAVKAVGGYDVKCTRAQDYDLWLRLGRSLDLAALPEVLYRHTVHSADDPYRSTPEQASVAAKAMLDAWRLLSDRTPTPMGAPDPLLEAIRSTLSRDHKPGEMTGSELLEAMLHRHPSREALLAWLWTQWAQPPSNRRAIEIGRLARLRELGLLLRGERVPRIYLWGAGEHTRFILQHESDLGLAIAGVVDDHAHGQTRFGRHVTKPDTLLAGEVALISSDWHEDAIWERSEAHRARGVRVVRFYADDLIPRKSPTHDAWPGARVSLPNTEEDRAK
jgi:hypothetical protein